MKYRLLKNMVGRNATTFNYFINTYKGSIFFKKEKEERKINVKSLIGLLSGNFKEGDIVTLYCEDYFFIQKILNHPEHFIEKVGE